MTGATSYVTCPLCEATCGLAVDVTAGVELDGPRIRVRGDRDDVFSKGYVCPKGTSIGALHSDPDRLRVPLVKREGRFVEVSWGEALAEVARRLPPIVEASGPQAVAAYFGNPTAHNLAGALYLRALIKALGTTNVFSAGASTRSRRCSPAATSTATPQPSPSLTWTAPTTCWSSAAIRSCPTAA